MRRYRRALYAVVAAVALALTAGVAYGAALTQTLSGGDSLAVKCAGSQLNWTRQNSTNMTLKCRPSATPTPSVTPSVTPSTSPTPSPSPTPTPTPSSTPTGNACVTSAPSGNCGPYSYAGITNSNGYNTYVGNNCWGDPNCKQTVTANSPGDWTVTSTEPANNGSVKTYPNVAQLTTTPASGYQADYALANLSSLTSTYAETTPYGGGMIAQFAYDVWISNAVGASDEIMLWTDNSGRDPEDAGAKFCQQTTIAGQVWTLNTYNGGVCGKADGEVIFSLGARHAAAQQPSGTVDIKAMLDYLVSIGWESSNLTIGQIDAGWEVCSTGGAARTFGVSNYTLTIK